MCYRRRRRRHCHCNQNLAGTRSWVDLYAREFLSDMRLWDVWWQLSEEERTIQCHTSSCSLFVPLLHSFPCCIYINSKNLLPTETSWAEYGHDSSFHYKMWITSAILYVLRLWFSVKVILLLVLITVEIDDICLLECSEFYMQYHQLQFHVWVM